MVRVVAAASVAALALAGCSGDAVELTATGREPIAGGVLDPNRDEVIELLTEWGSRAVAICTGTLIAPNLVVTARHCVASGGSERITCGSAPFSEPVPASALHATTDETPTTSSDFYTGLSVSVPPGGDDVCGFDLALVTLAENVPAAAARPAIPRIDQRPVTGEAYTAFGYGVDELGNDTAGRMRLEGLFVQCIGDRCPRGFEVTATEFLGQEGVCSGDSGGPAFDLQGRVIGVLSRGSDPCATPVYGSMAGFSDWIMETALAAAEAGGYPPPFWALTGTSDRPPGAEGDPCASAGECSDGTVCYYDSDPLDAVCTATCATSEDCVAPARCVEGFDSPAGGLCLPERPPAEGETAEKRPRGDGGCALGRSRSVSLRPAFLLGLLGLAVFSRRRRLANGRQSTSSMRSQLG